jgi:hypothetical protein
VKVQRWRGALWFDGTDPWLVAAGTREEGSRVDFYEELARGARRNKVTFNRSNAQSVVTDTLISHLLPTTDDTDRLRLEDSLRWIDDTRKLVPTLVIAATMKGEEQVGRVLGCSIAVVVERSYLDAIFVGIRFRGPVPDNITAVVLDSVPAVVDRKGWMVDAMPGRSYSAGESVWSNFLNDIELDLLVASYR